MTDMEQRKAAKQFINDWKDRGDEKQDIENEIEEKGGEDKAELLALLDEVKELMENIEASRTIPKQKGLFNRLSAHLATHGWFYGEIVALLGQQAITLLSK